MLARVLALAAGIGGGAGAAQFPEFSQQYLQRLSGAVDELGVVVADFDRSAQSAGLDRDQALEELQGTVFLDGRQQDMRRVIARHDRLRAEAEDLKSASAWSRLISAPAIADPELVERTWADYKPAVPVTAEGLTFGAAGFLAGFLSLSALLALAARLVPGRRHRA